MARLFVPIRGEFTGGEASPWGEPLAWDGWSGAEVGSLGSPRELWAAVAEVEMRDWVLGVRYPLWGGVPEDMPFLDASTTVRQRALSWVRTTMDEAHGAGAQYLVLPFPCPWDRESARRGHEVLVGVGEGAAVAGLELRLALHAPAPGLDPAWTPGLVTGLFAGHPNLALAADVESLVAIARASGRRVDDLVQAWLPMLRHFYLEEVELASGRGGLPALPDLPAGRFAGTCRLAETVAGAHGRLRVVLSHVTHRDPAGAERAREWARGLRNRAGA